MLSDTKKKYKRRIKSIPKIFRLPIVFMFFCLVLVLVFGMIYSLSDDSFKVSGNAESGLNIFEGIYFSVVTITTLGYGEILPLNWWGQLLVIFETLLGVFCLGLLLTSIGYSLGLRQSAIQKEEHEFAISLKNKICLLYTSPSPRD